MDRYQYVMVLAGCFALTIPLEVVYAVAANALHSDPALRRARVIRFVGIQRGRNVAQ
jgi:hypothetical protein